MRESRHGDGGGGIVATLATRARPIEGQAHRKLVAIARGLGFSPTLADLLVKRLKERNGL
jgi:hypothetical protein